MGDVLLAVSIPFLVGASGIYAACSCWWRRKHPAPPPYSQSAARLAELDVLAIAEGIVRESWAQLDDLYHAPMSEPGATMRP